MTCACTCTCTVPRTAATAIDTWAQSAQQPPAPRTLALALTRTRTLALTLTRTRTLALTLTLNLALGLTPNPHPRSATSAPPPQGGEGSGGVIIPLCAGGDQRNPSSRATETSAKEPWERKTVQPPPARGLRFLHARHQSEAQQAAAATRPAAEWPWARARTEGSVRDETVSRKSGKGCFLL